MSLWKFTTKILQNRYILMLTSYRPDHSATVMLNNALLLKKSHWYPLELSRDHTTVQYGQAMSESGTDFQLDTESKDLRNYSPKMTLC